jgi:predicted porin
MKKTLVALAALASIGSAFADAPTITPYARIDLGVGQTTTDGAPDAGLTAVNGGYNTSVIGFKGEQDIVGGNKVFGKAEIGFGPAGGTGWANNSWGRTGIVGVSGGFGALQLGMDWSPYDNAFNEAMDYQHFSAIATSWNGGGVHGDNGNDKANSGAAVGHVQYTTPTISGFNASLMYAPSKDTTTGNTTSYTSAGVNFNAGPLALTAAMEVVPTANSFAGAAAGDGANTTAYVLTAAYNLGVATVYGAFESAKADGVKGATKGSATDTGSAVGVKVPMGDLTLSAGWATESTSGDVSNKRSSFAVQGLYALNKAASAYVGYVNSKDDTTGKDLTTNKWAAGLTFSF